ncbi:hypothetical protein [Actinomadura parmotrematis]|uniref:Uncharacterized protein n=1 Tax=Actinomadura parmotrematis TaxID=2864039 RepID=A0ABS7FUP2_9ACTN|nr:hypothetical protein [Actinomadura parmotrematis]MBW8483910.1 hypothetical protein [Actinomadura parmotrematis]
MPNDEPAPDEPGDAWWLAPALITLAARGAHAALDDGGWGVAARSLLVLAALSVPVAAALAVRRRAYETLVMMGLGLVLLAALAYARGDLP